MAELTEHIFFARGSASTLRSCSGRLSESLRSSLPQPAQRGNAFPLEKVNSFKSLPPGRTFVITFEKLAGVSSACNFRPPLLNFTTVRRVPLELVGSVDAIVDDEFSGRFSPNSSLVAYTTLPLLLLVTVLIARTFRVRSSWSSSSRASAGGVAFEPLPLDTVTSFSHSRPPITPLIAPSSSASSPSKSSLLPIARVSRATLNAAVSVRNLAVSKASSAADMVSGATTERPAMVKTVHSPPEKESESTTSMTASTMERASMMNSVVGAHSAPNGSSSEAWALALPLIISSSPHAPAATPATPLIDASALSKYSKMLSMGVPSGAVLNKMQTDGVENAVAALRAIAGGTSDTAAGSSKPAFANGCTLSSGLGLSLELSQHLDALFKPRAEKARAPAAPATAADASRKVSLLDNKRAIQIGLGLARLKCFSRDALLEMLQSLVPLATAAAPETALSSLQASLLADCVPRAAEASALRVWVAAHPTERHRLSDTDVFQLECMRVQNVAARADALFFRVSLAARLDELTAAAAVLANASIAVANNRILQRIASAAIALAARIPEALSAGGTFDLVSLKALQSCRAPGVSMRDSRGTVLHVLAAILDRTDSEAAAFVPEAAIVAGAAGAFSALANDVSSLEAGAAAFRALAPPLSAEALMAKPGEGHETDASAPARSFADALDKAISRLRTDVACAGKLFATSYASFRAGGASASAGLLVSTPTPEVVFSSIVDFAIALKRARADVIGGR